MQTPPNPQQPSEGSYNPQPQPQPIQMQPNTQQQQYAPPQQPPFPQYAQQQPMQPPMQQPGGPQGQQMPYQQPQQQQMMPPQYQQPVQPVIMQNVNVNVNAGKKQPGGCARAIYFVCIGWWLGFAWMNIGFFCVFSIILLPVGLVMLNNLPKIITLRPSSDSGTSVNVSSVMQQGPNGPVMVQNVNVSVGGVQQHSFLLRAIYFICFGWYAGYVWALVGYACIASFWILPFLLPVGVMMLNRLPAVITLRKN